mmetsp:Transcript_6219/g.9143  ORF Transcript_6219/g.9143 Transcript_6219/m.9143 type:complete len:1448 (-) Transcript_6219:149-4492(-)
MCKSSETGKDEKKKDDGVKPAKFTELFRYADGVSMAAVFVGVVSCVFAGATLPGINIVFGDLIDSIASPTDITELITPAIYAMLVLGAVGFTSFFFSFFCFGWAATRIANGFRIEYLKGVLRQDAQHFDHAEPGSIALTLSDAAFDIQSGLADKFASMLQGFFQFVFGFALAFYYGPLLTLILLSLVPFLGIITYFLATYGAQDGVTGRKAYESAGGIASEALSNMRTIMSLNAETDRSTKYDSQLSKAEKAAIKQGTGVAGLTGLIFLVIFVMYGLGFWYGGVMIADSTDEAMANFPPPDNMFNEDGTLNEGSPWYATINKTACMFYMDTASLAVCACGIAWDTVEDVTSPNCGCSATDPSLPPLQQVCFTGGQTLMVFFSILLGGIAIGQVGPGLKALTTARISAARMLEVIDSYPDIDVTKTAENSSQKALSREDVKGEIRFEDVAFHYTPKETGEGYAQPPPVFAKINLTMKAGETVALVGESGCGKSTISKLVQRFYDPTSGRVLLDGVDIKELALKDLRANIGVVSQEPLLFDTSVLENIRFGKPDATDNEVISAAKNANAHDFISKFPEGYYTKVGPKGGKLSGGQKQRIAIARALLRDPPILVLDEATSALDNKSEKVVQKTLDKLVEKKGNMSSRTTIVIAHRMSTIRNADRICVFGSPEGTSTAANGSIILEEGNHDELMKIKGGFYKALVMAGGKASVDTSVNLSTKVGTYARRYVSDNDESEKEWDADDPYGEEKGTDDDDDSETEFTELGNSSGLSVSSSQNEEKKGGFKKLFAAKDAEEKEKEKVEKEALKRNKSRIWEYAKLDLSWIIFGSVASAAKGTIFPLLSLVFSQMILTWYDSDTDNVRAESLFYSYMFYGIAVLAFVAEVIQKGVFEFVGERLCRRMRSDLFRGMLRQDVTYFDDEKNAVGVLTSNLSTDVKFLRLVTGQPVAATIETFAAMTTGIIIALTASWEIFLIMLAMVPLLAAAEGFQWIAMSGSETNVKKSIESCSSKLSETVNGIREVQAFALQDTVTKDIETSISETVLPKSILAAIMKGIMMGLIQLIQFCVYAFAFWFGGQMISQERIGFDDFMRALWAMAFAASGLGQAALFFGDASKASAAVTSISLILDRKADIDSEPWENGGLAEKETGMPAVREVSKAVLQHGEWDLKDVNFAYPTRPNARVFNQINLTIPRGKTVALVGSSGCGKSTIVQLLERFYDPTAAEVDASEEVDGGFKLNFIGSDLEQGAEMYGSKTINSNSGEVQLDEKDLRSLDVRWVRKHVGLVGQEPVLFNDTVYNNIALGKEGCTREEVETAAKSANAYDFIMGLPDQFETNVGIMGSKVSGGQKQRIAIARALVSKPKILLLDEATSALDNESEKIVQASLDKLLKESAGQRTTVIIAHRLSTIRNADVICVLDNDGDGSRVVEKGTHEELMELGNKYKALVEAYAK